MCAQFMKIVSVCITLNSHLLTLKAPVTNKIRQLSSSAELFEASLINLVAPHQTAPTGAVWSGSTLFVLRHKAGQERRGEILLENSFM